jgi:hypothetical protein
MKQLEKINLDDIEVLRVIGNGHPSCKMTANKRSNSSQVAALTWDEICIDAKNKKIDIGNSIARLTSNQLIDSGSYLPSLLRLMFGGRETFYFWISDTGREFLQYFDSQKNDADLDFATRILVQLGYDITPYGVGVASLSLVSGYSAAETASHLALVTLAHDCNSTTDISIFVAQFEHSMAMIKILAEYRDAGQIRPELYNNDVTAIVKIAYVDEHTIGWIEKVLSDPVIQKNRVAISRINYQEMVDFDDDEVDP